MNCVCKLTLATLLAFTTTSQADTIYTWEDEDGTVHFSDRPQPGATELKLNVPEPAPPAQATTHEAGPAATTASIPDDALPPATIKLISPRDQLTIRSNEGIIRVRAEANRKMNRGHSVRLLLDGEPYGRPQTQLHWQLTNIDRGSHTLQSQLLKYGKVIASSEQVTVFLHRATAKSRNAPAPMPK